MRNSGLLLLACLPCLFSQSQLLWTLEHTGRGESVFFSALLGGFSDVALETLTVFGLLTFFLFLRGEVGDAIRDAEDLVHNQLLPGVFGEAEAQTAAYARVLWVGFAAATLGVYAGAELVAVGRSAGSLFTHPVFLLCFSATLWAGGLVFTSLRHRFAAPNVLIPKTLAEDAIGGGLFLIELLSFSTRAVSLGLRFFANILSSSTIESLVEGSAWAAVQKAVSTAGAGLIGGTLIFFAYNSVLSFGENIAMFVQPFILTLLLATTNSEVAPAARTAAEKQALVRGVRRCAAGTLGLFFFSGGAPDSWCTLWRGDRALAPLILSDAVNPDPFWKYAFLELAEYQKTTSWGAPLCLYQPQKYEEFFTASCAVNKRIFQVLTTAVLESVYSTAKNTLFAEYLFAGIWGAASLLPLIYGVLLRTRFKTKVQGWLGRTPCLSLGLVVLGGIFAARSGRGVETPTKESPWGSRRAQLAELESVKQALDKFTETHPEILNFAELRKSVREEGRLFVSHQSISVAIVLGALFLLEISQPERPASREAAWGTALGFIAWRLAVPFLTRYVNLQSLLPSAFFQHGLVLLFRRNPQVARVLLDQYVRIPADKILEFEANYFSVRRETVQLLEKRIAGIVSDLLQEQEFWRRGVLVAFIALILVLCALKPFLFLGIRAFVVRDATGGVVGVKYLRENTDLHKFAAFLLVWGGIIVACL